MVGMQLLKIYLSLTKEKSKDESIEGEGKL